MSDLDKLIEAVEAGSLPTFPETVRAVRGADADAVDVDMAFNGYLDAALSLHEALLPGWGWETGVNATFTSIAQVWKDGRSSAFQGVSELPARAWLLAILRAVKAKEGRE